MSIFGNKKKMPREKQQKSEQAEGAGKEKQHNEEQDLQMAVLRQKLKEELKQEIKEELKQEMQSNDLPEQKKSGQADKQENSQANRQESRQVDKQGKEESRKEGKENGGAQKEEEKQDASSGEEAGDTGGGEGTAETGQSNGEEKAEEKNGAEKAKKIPKQMKSCETLLKTIFDISADVIIKRFQTVQGEALILCIDGLADRDLQDRDMIAPLKSPTFNGDVRLALHTPFQEIDNIPEVVGRVLDGASALFFEGLSVAFVSELKHWDMRGVETPDAEAVIRGPKEGFNENLRTNTSLLRRKIKTPKLTIENLTLGRQTNTIIALVYIKGIVNERVLGEVRRRLARIDTDAILESGYIEQYIDRHVFSVIPRVGMTQKPDILAARILEGRVGILCDGTPHAITVPHLFIENLQTAEDYYSRTVLGNFMRLIRLTALFFSLFLPGLFLAIATFHHEMIPTVFLSKLISSVEKTPFPLGAELFLLILMFELLRESGTRLPRAIGSAISIVGALIIGDAAVSAGIVSAPVVIIVALTAVCGFVNTSLNEFITIYRILFLLLGGVMGLIGIASGFLFLLVQAASAESFGVSILDSFSQEGRRDSAVRFPLWKMIYRPPALVGENKRRQK